MLYPLLHTFVPPHRGSVVDSIRLKPANSFLQAKKRFLSLCSPSFSPFHLNTTWILSSPSKSLHTKICTNTISHVILFYSLFFFLVPTALRRLTNKCITHPTADAVLLFASFPLPFCLSLILYYHIYVFSSSLSLLHLIVTYS